MFGQQPRTARDKVVRGDALSNPLVLYKACASKASKKGIAPTKQAQGDLSVYSKLRQ